MVRRNSDAASSRPFPDSRRWSGVCLAVLLTGCVAAGCDQVKSIVDEVGPAGGSGPAVTPATTPAPPVAAAPTEAESVTPITPPEPALSPDQLASGLLALSPRQINDAALRKVAEVPEAAILITELDLTAADVTGAGISGLRDFPALQSVTLQGVTVQPDELRGIGEAGGLRTLTLNSTHTDDAVLASVAKLTHLRTLRLDNTPITSTGVTALSTLTELEELSLQDTRVDDQAIAGLSAMPLRKLNLAGTLVTSVLVDKLADIRTLEELDISRNRRVTGAAFKRFPATGLKVLNASETSFGVEGLVALRGHKTLEELHLFAAAIVEHQQANVFRTMPKLRVLTLSQNPLTDQGMHVFLKGVNPLEELYLRNVHAVTDQGLAALITCRNLKVLDVIGTRVSVQGVTALKAKLPECRIVAPDGSVQ